MKKKYQKPSMAIFYLELQKMVAASDYLMIDKSITKDPSQADSRFVDWEDDFDEEY